MFYAKIPPEMLMHMGLFGFENQAEDGKHIRVLAPCGQTLIVNKQNPWLVFEDETEAMQMKAIALTRVPKN